MTFIDEYLSNRATDEDIHDHIDAWHEGRPDVELHVFLGLTWPEYSLWMEKDVLPTAESREPDKLFEVRLQGGEKIVAHGVAMCEAPCAIHWPSSHHMRSWPQQWRTDRGIIERVCDHGVGHPDPDDRNRDKLHGCCGCCIGMGSEVFE